MHISIGSDHGGFPLKEHIKAYLEGQGGTRPRRYYRLTAAGRGRLQEKEQEWRQYVMAVERVLKGGECLA